jgi:transcriptional regulator with XRE-family HTH domain
MNDLGQKLKQARHAKNMDQGQLARELGVTQSCISQFENGQRYPKEHMLSKLSTILGMSKEMLSNTGMQQRLVEVLERAIKNLDAEDMRMLVDYAQFLKWRMINKKDDL